MDLVIAADHAGFARKAELVATLKQWGHRVLDLGPVNDDRTDYPDYANKVCQVLADKPERIGILICGSGQGMAMRANKFKHIRAALCWNIETATLAREHNNANVLCLGSRLLSEVDTLEILKTFLATEFAGGRHLGRVQKISEDL